MYGDNLAVSRLSKEDRQSEHVVPIHTEKTSFVQYFVSMAPTNACLLVMNCPILCR